MNIYYNFIFANDKGKYFNSLSSNDKKELWNKLTSKEKSSFWIELTDTQKKSLFSLLSIKEIHNFISMLGFDEKKGIYQFFDRNKLRGYYKSLDEYEKKEMVSLIDKDALDLLVSRDNINNEIKEANKSINDSYSAINKSQEAIVNAKQERRDTRKELRSNKVSLKKATRDEKKKYIKMLRASRPSVLDKIGFISKIRSRKLAEATDLYLKANQELQKYQDKELKLKEKIDSLNEKIDREEENKKSNYDNIKLQSAIVNDASLELKNINAKIKSLNKAEKKLLGRKLAGKQVDARNKVMITSKLKGKNSLNSKSEEQEAVIDEPTQTVEAPSQVVETPTQTVEAPAEVKDVEIIDKNDVEVVDTKNTTRDTVEYALITIDRLSSNGVVFNPPIVNFSPVVSERIEREPINTLNYEQLMIICSAVAFYCAKQIEKQRHEQQVQGQNVGYSRVYSKGNVSLGLLASIIFLLLTFLFFVF